MTRKRKIYHNADNSPLLKKKEIYEIRKGPSLNDGEDFTLMQLGNLLEKYIQGDSLESIAAAIKRPVETVENRLRKLIGGNSALDREIEFLPTRTNDLWTERDEQMVRWWRLQQKKRAEYTKLEMTEERIAMLLFRDCDECKVFRRRIKSKPASFDFSCSTRTKEFFSKEDYLEDLYEEQDTLNKIIERLEREIYD